MGAKHYKAEYYQRAVDLRAQGMKYASIARELSIPQSSVKNWFYQITRSVKNAGICDCGNPATHFDVALNVLTPDGYQRAEKYDLCEDCWQLENEPLQTKGEAVWNR
jgi:hypothetical protein